LIDVNNGSYLTFSETVVNVRADLQPSNKKEIVLQFKMGNFVKIRQKIIFLEQ